MDKKSSISTSFSHPLFSICWVSSNTWLNHPALGGCSIDLLPLNCNSNALLGILALFILFIRPNHCNCFSSNSIKKFEFQLL
jgi:hypothetical protein